MCAGIVLVLLRALAIVMCGHVQGVVYGKPVHQGITQLKPARNLKNIAEERVGRKIGSLRVLNSYWVNQVRSRQGGRRTPAVSYLHTITAERGFMCAFPWTSGWWLQRHLRAISGRRSDWDLETLVYMLVTRSTFWGLTGAMWQGELISPWWPMYIRGADGA